jgi:hypothetical protein
VWERILVSVVLKVLHLQLVLMVVLLHRNLVRVQCLLI